MTKALIKAVVSIDYRAITNTNPLKGGFDTTLIFDASRRIGEISPIDEFITNNNEINKIWLGPNEPSPELASLVLLGYVSATESYMRAVFRGLIHIDCSCRRHLSGSQISFAAAMNHERINMPDALLEDTTFIGAESVKKAVGRFLNLPKVFPGMDKHFEEFEKICQLRHCCTHRFGKLGAKNAAVLGMSAHNRFLEKPLKLTSATLSDAAEILRTFVKSFNNEIFGKIMERTVSEQLNQSISPTDKVVWVWDYNIDKPIFERYYKLFASKNDSIRSKSCKTTYDGFVTTLKPVAKIAVAKVAVVGSASGFIAAPFVPPSTVVGVLPPVVPSAIATLADQASLTEEHVVENGLPKK